MIYLKKVKIIKDFHINLDVSSNGIHDSVIYCKEGDQLTPTSIIAKVFRSDSIITFDLIEELEIRAYKNKEDLQRFIDVVEGQIIQKGKIIAHKSSLTSDNIIKAPFDGVVSIDTVEDLPKIILSSMPSEVEVKSYIYGEVIKTDKDKIVVKTNILRIFPNFSFGRSIFSHLKLLSEDGSLDNEFEGSVIYFEGCLSYELAQKAIKSGAVGIVAISTSSDVLAINNESFTIVSLEGFGEININIYDKIRQSEGQAIFIDAEKSEIIIGTKLSIEDLKEVYIKGGSFNDTVQIFDNKNYGSIGKVKGIDGNVCEISIGEGKVVKILENNILGVLN